MKKKFVAIVAVAAALVLCFGVMVGCSSNSSKAKYTLLNETLQDEHFAVAFKLGDTDLANAINQGIANVDKDGTVKKLCEKYGIDYAKAWCFKAPATAVDTSAFKGQTLKLGFDNEFPPMGFVGTDGKDTGFDLELAKAVCDNLGMTLECQAIDWNAKDSLLASGVINCIWNGFTAEGRESAYTLSTNYMVNTQTIAVKAGSSIKSSADLKGKNVVTQSGSAAFELLEGDKADLKATFGNFTSVPSYMDALMQVDSGAADAVIGDSVLLQYYIANSK